MLAYTASVHHAWIRLPNSERITENSCSYLQVTRSDFVEVTERMPIDAHAEIVTVVIDCTTDAKHFHLCKERTSGPSTTGDLASELAARSAKDDFPQSQLVDQLAKLAVRVKEEGKVLHLITTGCNTINIILPLHKAIKRLGPELLALVWVLVTTKQWSADISTMLWHHYGELVDEELDSFRIQTRTLLDSFTWHWRRSNIAWEGDAKEGESLADYVLLDRLDRLEIDWCNGSCRISKL